jgi:hypothetical protein
MIEILSGVIAALASGALAKAGEIGGRAVTDAYDALKELLIHKLGKVGAVQSVEDEPNSVTAQTALAEALDKAGLISDAELGRLAAALREAVASTASRERMDIEIGSIYANANVLVDNLAAQGRINLGDIRAETGDATLTNLSTGVAIPKKD